MPLPKVKFVIVGVYAVYVPKTVLPIATFASNASTASFRSECDNECDGEVNRLVAVGLVKVSKDVGNVLAMSYQPSLEPLSATLSLYVYPTSS